MNLQVINACFTVCKINSLGSIQFGDEFVFVSKTDEELSLVCNTQFVPEETIAREDGWKGFRIQGELDFSLVGILAKISTILAEQGISIFAISTFNTDYILIKEEKLDAAVNILSKQGYLFS